jgi:cytochrome P450
VKLGQRFKQYPLFRITSYNITWIVTNNMESVKHVMLKNATNYPKPPEHYSALLLFGHNIVSASGGELHRLHRRIVEPAFDEKHLRHLVDVSNESTDLLIKKLDGSGTKKLEVNHDMTMVTMDIIGKSNFGTDLKIFDEDSNAKHTQFDKKKHTESFYDALEGANTMGIAMFNFIPESLHWLPLFNPVRKHINETKSYIEELVEQRKKEEGHLDLLSLLLQSNEHGATKLSPQEIISDAFIFLFAGHETSATSSGHLLYEIAKHPEVQKKLQEEVDRVLHGRNATYDDVANMPYLMNCIKEALRLHSPVNSIPKIAKKNDEICGYQIPKGALFFVNFYIVHWNNANWSDAMSFKPERFSEKYDPLAFLSFSYGTRKCVGFNFSLVETAAIIAKLIQNYEFSFEDNVDPATFKPKEVVLVTVKIDKLYLKLKKRN